MVSSEILAFHALFGCDYTAAPSRKREVRLLKYLESIQEVPCAFSNLAEDIVNIGEEITSDARLFFFFNMYKKRWQISDSQKF